MFDITGDHITRLSDGDLRTLVTRLCEAELRRVNLPLAAVTAGGDQNAPDGGIDVRVELTTATADLDFIPKAVTGFQVKKPDMPAGAITEEMRPGGVLRSSIVQIASKHGAYIIVSAQGSTSDSALENRKNTMQLAIVDLPDDGSLYVDFYDRDRLARWVRSYPGVVLWLRERIGEPLAGWRPYGNWAYGDPVDSTYLLDDKCRIVASQTGHRDTLTVEQGIQGMRSILESPTGIIRLIGLSGTGKTRLVQALFDSTVGSNALDHSIVIYVDQGSELPPTPSARDMIHRLAADGRRAILVVDNCNPATHRDLAQAVSTTGDSLSLITVEYDVSDDEPEETNVFRLEPASEKVIEEILERLASNVSHADRHRVAEFSSGNARIALALARTVTHNENLGTLKDAELFKRLFHQRKDCGDALMRAAEVCSLVYSFDGETIQEDIAELPVLAELAGISANELYRHVSELQRRDLVQRRGKWRAVLPHALANRLARQALCGIHSNTLLNAVSQQGKERLLKSFSRRLGYLHDCEQAKQIAENWLGPQGWLSNPTQLNGLGISMFKNVAPLAPGWALEAIEAVILGENGKAFLSTENSNRGEWCGLLRSIAFEAQYFKRATLLLAMFSAEETGNYRYNPARGYFKELFKLYLSGTHATVGERLDVVRELLDAENDALNKVGLEMLGAMLESMNFGSSHDFSFGARPRDFGWEPATGDEVSAWFREVVLFAKHLIASGSPLAPRIRIMLAQHFTGLWVHGGICGELEGLIRDLPVQDGWPDAWLAIRKTIHLHIRKMSSEFAARTRRLESEIRPQGLEQKIRAHVLSQNHRYVDLIESEPGIDDGDLPYEKQLEILNNTVTELAIEAALSPETLDSMLPDLLRGTGGNTWQFGRGLAKGGLSIDQGWEKLCGVLSTLPEKDRSISLLQGFISAVGMLDLGKASQLLDAAITDPLLGPYFPILQSSVQIDEVGAKRLLSSIAHGHVGALQFKYLEFGPVSDSIPLHLFREILLGVASLPGGYQVAVEIFGMRLHSLKTDNIEIDSETASLGRQLLILEDFCGRDQNHPYHVNELAIACLKGDVGFQEALMISRNLARALGNYRSEARQYCELAETLFRLQPAAAIKGLLERTLDRRGGYSLAYLFSFDRDSPVNAADPEVLMRWACRSRKVRLPKLANEIHLFVRNDENGALIWSPLALNILETAPDRTAILEIYATRFSPRSYSGSLSDVLAPYLSLANQLQSHNDPLVVAWAKKQTVHLNIRIEEDRRRERRVDESFE